MEGNVPEYLKALTEAGLNPAEAFKIAAGEAGDPATKVGGPNMKAVQ